MKNMNFMDFIKSEKGIQVQNFLSYLIENETEWDVIVFLTRKGYWLYRMACWYLGLRLPDGKVVVSDRKIDKGDIQEIRRQAGKTNAIVYIVDDTLSTGVTAHRIYDLIERVWPEASIFPVACFLAVSLDEMKNYLFTDEKEDGFSDGFIENMSYFYKASPVELGRFSYEQALVAQQELVPYVVDLPFLVDESFKADRLLSCFTGIFDENANRRYSVMENDEFMRMCEGNQKWKYVDNSYEFSENNCIHTGIFIYYGEELFSILRDAALNLIVKCRYEELDQDRKAVLFTPFVMLKSASYEDIWDAFESIYKYYPNSICGNKKTNHLDYSDYYKYISGRLKARGEEDISLNIFRAVIYFFSYYLGKVFMQWVWTDFGLNLRFDESFMRENSGSEFVDFISGLKDRSVSDFLPFFENISPWMSKYFSISLNTNTLSADVSEALEKQVYIAVYLEVIDRKRRNHVDGCFTIEEMERCLKEKFIFGSEEELRIILTKILLKMLDTSVVGNRVWYDQNTIYRGFRYGENSDIMLPFFNPYLYYGVDLFYRMLSWDKDQDIRERYFDNIEKLFDRMGDMLRNQGYMGYVVTENEFAYNKLYFKDKGDIFSTLIENKRFMMDGEDTEEIIYRDIDKVVRKFYLSIE